MFFLKLPGNQTIIGVNDILFKILFHPAAIVQVVFMAYLIMRIFYSYNV